MNTECTNDLRMDMMKAWRRLAFRILVYLRANPGVLAANNNQEIYDRVREIQICYHRRGTSKSDEEVGEIVDFLVELKIKHDDGNDYFVEQETMELYRPSAARDKEWELHVFIEILFYATSPDIYSKTIHELALKEDSEVEE